MKVTEQENIIEADGVVGIHSDPECDSCAEGVDDVCPNSKRPCGHHCNHSWSDDSCCWCGKEWGEDGEEEMKENIKRLAEEFMGWHKERKSSHWYIGDGTIAAFGDWNPFTSLNHARMLEDEVERRGLQAKYIAILLAVIDKGSGYFYGLTRTQIFTIAHATPAQRAEAVLRLMEGEK